MYEQKFDLKELLDYKPTMKVVVTRKNQPNLDNMAKAFHDLLKNK